MELERLVIEAEKQLKALLLRSCADDSYGSQVELREARERLQALRDRLNTTQHAY